MAAGRIPDYDEPAAALNGPTAAGAGPVKDRHGPEAASTPVPPAQEPEIRYRLCTVREHDGLLNPRGWVERTQFVLKEEARARRLPHDC